MTNTLIVVILDESGSMDENKSDVIGGYNNFIENEKNVKDDKSRFYLIKFNSIVNVVHEGVELENVPRLSGINYQPSGHTALYDAVANGIKMAEKEYS